MQKIRIAVASLLAIGTIVIAANASSHASSKPTAAPVPCCSASIASTK